MDEIVTAYRAATRRSEELVERFQQVLPGGETRSVTFYPPYPVVIARGAGARVWDLDGNSYLDVLNNYTSLVHGHAAGPLLEAALEALADGSAHPAPGMHQLALAEAISTRYPAAQLVRFTNSGTEAATLALRLARHVTGRRRMIMFDGGYHGTAPEFADESPDTVRVPFNDIEALRLALIEPVAAVFSEPFLGSGGVVPASPGFLDAAADAATQAGALFVLDEVQALRSAEHGVQASLRRLPDLVLMGKVIGGGFPVGALGGQRELMAMTAGNRPDALKHSGTFNGNPVTAAAGLASLRLLDAPAIASLNEAAADLASRIEAAGADAGVRIVVSRYGSIMHVHFRDGLPENAADVRAEPAPAAAALHLSLLVHGVYAAPRGMLNLSTALSSTDLEAVAGAYRAAIADVVRAGLVPDTLTAQAPV
jgi:glutamate-1-semialdehyde 2,1-aminomutase